MDQRRPISIHALREEGDIKYQKYLDTKGISIHALREEGDYPASCFLLDLDRFLSTPSARRATLDADDYGFGILFLSTPSARRATPEQVKRRLNGEFLSTPSARRATGGTGREQLHRCISIHALREEGDISSRPLMIPNNKFLSTPSARRATRPRRRRCWRRSNFYPRPPRGGRQQKQRQNLYFLINYTTFCTNLEEP